MYLYTYIKKQMDSLVIGIFYFLFFPYTSPINKSSNSYYFFSGMEIGITFLQDFLCDVSKKERKKKKMRHALRIEFLSRI